MKNSMTDFEQLTQAIQQFIEERDWKQFHKPKDCAISLTLEAAEILLCPSQGRLELWGEEVEAVAVEDCVVSGMSVRYPAMVRHLESACLNETKKSKYFFSIRLMQSNNHTELSRKSKHSPFVLSDGRYLSREFITSLLEASGLIPLIGDF